MARLVLKGAAHRNISPHLSEIDAASVWCITWAIHPCFQQKFSAKRAHR